MEILKNILYFTSSFFGWMFIAFGMGSLLAMTLGYYIVTPKVSTVVSFIGIGILIAGQKNSEITMIEFIMALAIVSILAGNSPLFA